MFVVLRSVGAGHNRISHVNIGRVFRGGSVPELPKGWEGHVDVASGLPYYVHTATGESSWERPTEPNSSVAKPVNGWPGTNTAVDGTTVSDMEAATAAVAAAEAAAKAANEAEAAATMRVAAAEQEAARADEAARTAAEAAVSSEQTAWQVMGDVVVLLSLCLGR